MVMTQGRALETWGKATSRGAPWTSFFSLILQNQTLSASSPGLMGFAQKLVVKRGNSDAMGKLAIVFLISINGEMWLLAAMMCDAANEAMVLIRFLDDENMTSTMLCRRVERFLAHITWLFHEGGAFTIEGHTAFIVKWYESSPHHWQVNGAGRMMGGQPFTDQIKEKRLEHMKAYVILAQQTCFAEFPSISVISCFSVFELPNCAISKAAKDVSADVVTKLSRLALMFNAPRLLSQYKARWWFAYKASVDSNHTKDHWACWIDALEVDPRRAHLSLHDHHEVKDILKVVKRGSVWVPVTSKVEQSFAKVRRLLGEHRLNATHEVENRTVNLLMTDHFNATEIDEIVDNAVAIWRECFQRHTRNSVLERADKGVVNTRASRCNPNSERAFLKRATDDTAAKASSSTFNLDTLQTTPKPSVWTDQHEDELIFQKNKHRKREVEAHMKGHTLPEERTEELRLASTAEKKRQEASYVSRVRARVKYFDKTHAVPPTDLELNGATCYSEGRMWNMRLLQRLVAINGISTAIPHEATLFLAAEPRNPREKIITVVAQLRGSWVVSPAVFLGHSGPSIKYCSALQTARVLYSTPLFRTNFTNEWLAILEVIRRVGSADRKVMNWNVVRTVHQWAAAKALADSKKKPATVIALADQQLECKAELKHVFALDSFLQFIAKIDPKKGSIGLLDM